MKEYELTIGGKPYCVRIEGIESGIASVSVNGERMSVAISREHKERTDPASPSFGNAKPAPRPAESTAREPEPSAPAKGTVLSPLPGVITSVVAREGAQIRKGEKIAVLEAMKMDNDILAEMDGTLLKVFVRDGMSVREGEPIAEIG